MANRKLKLVQNEKPPIPFEEAFTQGIETIPMDYNTALVIDSRFHLPFLTQMLMYLESEKAKCYSNYLNNGKPSNIFEKLWMIRHGKRDNEIFIPE